MVQSKMYLAGVLRRLKNHGSGVETRRGQLLYDLGRTKAKSHWDLQSKRLTLFFFRPPEITEVIPPFTTTGKKTIRNIYSQTHRG